MKKIITKKRCCLTFGILLLSASVTRAQTLMPLPAETQIQTAYTEPTGYWFVAPVNFNITGLKIPEGAGTGTQNIQVLKIQDNAPVFFSTNFETLFYIQNAPNNVVQTVNIPVNAGDTIGILGMTSGGTTSVYDGSAGTFSASIGTYTVDLKFLNAMNMELYLDTVANYNAFDIDNVGRVELYYAICDLSVDSVSASICKGETYTLGTQLLDTAGTYTEIFHTDAGCDSTVTLHLSMNDIDTSVIIDQGTLTAGATAAVYQWVNCDQGYTAVQGETNRSFAAAQNGSYAVIITQNGCSDTSGCYDMTGLSVGEIDAGNTISLYPNPVVNSINVRTTHFLHNASARILDVSGRVVFEQKGFYGHTLTLDVSNYTSGLYFMELREGTQTSRMKWIKQ